MWVKSYSKHPISESDNDIKEIKMRKNLWNVGWVRQLETDVANNRFKFSLKPVPPQWWESIWLLSLS